MTKWIQKIKNSLTLKIYIITAVLLALACLITYGFLAWFMPKSYSTLLDDVRGYQVEKLLEELHSRTVSDSFAVLERFARDTHSDLTLLDADGNTVFESEGAGVVQDWGDVYLESYVMEDVGDSLTIGTAVGTFSEVITVDFVINFLDGGDSYVLILSSEMVEINQVVEIFKRVLPWLVLVVAAVSLLGALVYARYITKPIVRISGISQKLAVLDFNWQCREDRNDEIGVLANSLNELASRLQTALGDLRQANAVLTDDIEKERERERRRIAFFAAVSHELKTPITVIKGQLEGMLLGVGNYRDRDKYLARSLQVAENLESIVQEILTISRLERGGFELQLDTVDLSEMVADCIVRHELLHQEKGQHILAEVEEGLCVQADRLLVRRAMDNIVGNAIRYSPDGADLYIKANRGRDGVCFTVLNTGVAIPEESIPHLFDAFYRVEQSRNRYSGGSGLGLYLVKMILDLHGAACTVENTAAGVQVKFTLKG